MSSIGLSGDHEGASLVLIVFVDPLFQELVVATSGIDVIVCGLGSVIGPVGETDESRGLHIPNKRKRGKGGGNN